MLWQYIQKHINPDNDIEIPISKFCDLLQFRFQIDRAGKPWLFDVKHDSTKFLYKDNVFDKFKRHLMVETILLIQKKLKVIQKKEATRLKTVNLLKAA